MYLAFFRRKKPSVGDIWRALDDVAEACGYEYSDAYTLALSVNPRDCAQRLAATLAPAQDRTP